MMSVKTMMATYARKHQKTQTSTFNNLLDWIAVPTPIEVLKADE
jgi:hypothetical protein